MQLGQRPARSAGWRQPGATSASGSSTKARGCEPRMRQHRARRPGSDIRPPKSIRSRSSGAGRVRLGPRAGRAAPRSRAAAPAARSGAGSRRQPRHAVDEPGLVRTGGTGALAYQRDSAATREAGSAPSRSRGPLAGLASGGPSRAAAGSRRARSGSSASFLSRSIAETLCRSDGGTHMHGQVANCGLPEHDIKSSRHVGSAAFARPSCRRGIE